MKTVFGFDVGLGSLGLAVRQDDDIIYADSLLIDANVATIQDQATRRRQKRTREAHKAREKHWKEIWQSIGKEPLNGIKTWTENGEWKSHKGDERLEREFADFKNGDNAIYTSCLLRILLLQGKTLEDWQIYKAIRSAFKRAGYPQVPWAKSHSKSDDKENKERTSEFIQKLEEIFPNENHRLPCYFDAYQMNLFDPETEEITLKQSHISERARTHTAPRELVKKELYLLLKQAAKQIPELKTSIETKIPTNEDWRDYVLYGDGFWKHGEYKGFYDTKINGILDQKRARFDNRCVNTCSCIPRFKVTRANNELYFQTHFLLKLRNMMVEKNQLNQKLTTEDIREWYEAKESERKKFMDEYFKQKKDQPDASIDYGKLGNKYKVMPKQWANWCEKKGYKVYAGTKEVPAPKKDGRTGFSRPAMILLRELILSGEGPHDFREKILANGLGKFGVGKKREPILKEKDLDFLYRMTDNDPEKIYIVPPTLVEQNSGQSRGDLEQIVYNIIGGTRDSVVRHRLTVFFEQLKKLENIYGEPQNIVMEFAREDFSSQEKKKNYEKTSNENNSLFEKAKNELAETFGVDFRKQNDKLVRKYMMWQKQGQVCPFTGDNLSFSELPNYEIEHIIPQGNKWNGPDAIENTVLTKRSTNAQKGERMPFECDFITVQWKAYEDRIEKMKISGRTKSILLARSAEEVEELIDRYYGLAVTSWVARLARDIACVWFGWQPGAEGENRKIHIVSGSLVGKIRRKYGLNKALNPFLSEEDKKKDRKNRNDKRHHALDAMVMTYLDEYARDPRKFSRFQLPERQRDARYFEEKLADVTPYKIARNKAALGDTAYRVIEQQTVKTKRGKKVIETKKITVGRVAIAEANPKKIIDPVIRSDIEKFLETKPTAEQKQIFFDNYRAKKVQVEKGKPDNQANLSKIKFARGQYYESKSISGTGTLQHGVYLYARPNQPWKVEPVYAFKSPYKTKQDLLAQGFEVKDNALFYPGCIIEITHPIEGKDVNVGRYTVKTIKTAGTIKLQNFKGDIFEFSVSTLEDKFHFIK